MAKIKGLFFMALCLITFSACNDETIEEELKGRYPYSFVIKIENAAGEDLLNANTEGSVCAEDSLYASEWVVTCEGKQCDILYSYEENGKIDQNSLSDVFLTTTHWYTYIDDYGVLVYHPGTISVDGRAINQGTNGEFKKIIFDWGGGFEPDVFEFKADWEESSGWVAAYKWNGEPLDKPKSNVIVVVK